MESGDETLCLAKRKQAYIRSPYIQTHVLVCRPSIGGLLENNENPLSLGLKIGNLGRMQRKYIFHFIKLSEGPFGAGFCDQSSIRWIRPWYPYLPP